MKIKITFAFLALLFALTSCAPVATPMPTATSSPTSIPPTFAASIPTPTLVSPQEPPVCTFPLPQTTMEESMPEMYTFSEPRIVLADPKSSFEIGEWLPDSQRILITRTIIENHYAKYQSLELFNPRAVKVQVYAKRERKYNSPPQWVAGLNALIYLEELYKYDLDANGNPIRSSVVSNQFLWLTSGDSSTAVKIFETQFNPFAIPHEWAISSIGVNPNGSQIVYIRNNGRPNYRLFIRKVTQGMLGTEQIIPFELPKQQRDDIVTAYEISWRPGTEQIFFYNSHGYPGDIHTYLFNVSRREICEIDFGAMWSIKYWPIVARWSPNGRYLAIIRVSGGLPIDFSDLAVLDTATGIQYTMAFSPEVEGRHYVWDIVWAPDNYHLAAIGTVSAHRHCAPSCMEQVGRMYLIDFISGKAKILFPSFQFAGGDLGDNLAWSPDGSKILANCWEKTARLCLIPVRSDGQ